jgi:hypothetical protein
MGRYKEAQAFLFLAIRILKKTQVLLSLTTGIFTWLGTRQPRLATTVHGQ